MKKAKKQVKNPDFETSGKMSNLFTEQVKLSSCAYISLAMFGGYLS